MLCFRLILWSVTLLVLLIPGTFFLTLVGRLAGFRPGRPKPGEVETAFSWVGLVFFGGLMLGICVVAGLIDFGVTWAVGRFQDVQLLQRGNLPQPPPPKPPIDMPMPKPTHSKPIRAEWIDAEMERTYLSDMPEFDAKVGWGGFGKKGKLGYEVDGVSDIKFVGQLVPNGISMHPPSRGHSTVKYRLKREAKLFVADMGLSDVEHFRPSAPAVFEVLGDGELLWSSIPIQQTKVKDHCRLSVEGVEVLELQVHCHGHYSHVRGVWLDPHILK